MCSLYHMPEKRKSNSCLNWSKYDHENELRSLNVGRAQDNPTLCCSLLRDRVKLNINQPVYLLVVTAQGKLGEENNYLQFLMRILPSH